MECVETSQTMVEKQCSRPEAEDSEEINTNETVTSANLNASESSPLMMETSIIGVEVDNIARTPNEHSTEKGIVTSVVIYKDWHLRQRRKRWKKKT